MTRKREDNGPNLESLQPACADGQRQQRRHPGCQASKVVASCERWFL
jgi:hypothetical protein